MQVPLLVYLPGVKAKRIDTPVALVDVVPTIMEMIGETDPLDTSGQSLLFPVLAKDQVSKDRAISCVTLTQGGTKRRYFKRGLRTGTHLLFNHRLDRRYELFATDEDPAEQVDLAESPEHQRTLNQLKRRLNQRPEGNLWKMGLR